MKTLMLKFELKEKVFVPELKTTGMVIGIYFEDTGLSYRVRWFRAGEPFQAILYEHELAEYTGQQTVGFTGPHQCTNP